MIYRQASEMIVQLHALSCFHLAALATLATHQSSNQSANDALNIVFESLTYIKSSRAHRTMVDSKVQPKMEIFGLPPNNCWEQIAGSLVDALGLKSPTNRNCSLPMRRRRPEGQNTSLAKNIAMHITVTDDSRDCKDESDEHTVFSRKKNFAPQICSCRHRCLAHVGPVLGLVPDRRFHSRTNETPPSLSTTLLTS